MKRGFTLIELLIVVAIIAILAAIVPNFLEAQVRAKVSRATAICGLWPPLSKRTAWMKGIHQLRGLC